MENGRKTKVAAYCRVSNDSDDQDGSFETQVEYYRNRLSADCYELVGVYGDHGKSGREMTTRPGLQRLLADVEDGKIECIYCKSISRLARNMAECTVTIRSLRERGVTLVFEKEGLRTDTPGVELILSIMATLAEEESHSISQNLLQIKEYKNSIGEPTEHPCYGYRRNGKGWRIEPNEAERVRLVFRMAAEGCRYNEILQELNRLEIQQPTRRRWTKQIIRYMLLNERYTGNYLTNKTACIVTERGKKTVPNRGFVRQYLIEGHHEAIVSQQLFELVGEMVREGTLCSRPQNQRKCEKLLRRARKLLEKEAA